jgi:hypothetical protein
MATSYYYRLVRTLPGSVQRRFYNFTRYADGYIDAVLDEREFHRRTVSRTIRDEIRSLLFLKFFLARLENAHHYATEAVSLAHEAGFGGWQVGTTSFGEQVDDDHRLANEKETVFLLTQLLRGLGVFERTRGPVRDVVRDLIRELNAEAPR